MIHNLKITPEYFNQVLSGKKKFELRKDDRDYKVQDVLNLYEWNGSSATGRSLIVRVTYLLRNCPEYGLKDGFVILSF